MAKPSQSADSMVLPLPSEPWELRRIEEQQRRRRMLEGLWDLDLERFILAHLGKDRTNLLGPLDLSSNFLRSASTQLATLFQWRPTVLNAAGPFPELLGETVKAKESPTGRPVRVRGDLERAGLWAMMPDVQRNTIACQEHLVHVGARQDRTGRWVPYFRPVWAGFIAEAEADPDDPSRLVRLVELREWLDPRPGGKGWIWTRHEFDIRNPAEPVFRVTTADRAGGMGEPVTALVYPELAKRGAIDTGGRVTGPAYWWRRGAGTGEPVIPFVIFHRDWPIDLFRPFAGREAADLTLVIAMLWSYWTHTVKTGAHALKYTAGLELDSDGTAAGTKRATGDVSGILKFVADPNAQQILVGQWGPAVDPLTLGQAIAAFEARGAQALGVDASDAVRTSGDPRSGYALEISQTAKDESRQAMAIPFQAATEELVELAAVLVNAAALEAVYPETGWIVEFNATNPDAELAEGRAVGADDDPDDGGNGGAPAQPDPPEPSSGDNQPVIQ